MSYSTAGERIRMLEVTAQTEAVRRIATLMEDTTPVANLAAEGASNQDIADQLGVPVELLETHLDYVLRRARAVLRSRIRRALLKAGDNGDSRVLGFLAVRYLEPDSAWASELPSDSAIDKPDVLATVRREAHRLAAG